MRKAYFFMFLLAASLTSRATDVSGPVHGVWTPGGNPYNVIGEITLPANQTLLIQPGVQVIFQGYHKFIIYGMLEAVGALEDSILLTTSDTSTGWHGLRFYNLNTQQDSSRLVYCHISYGLSSFISTPEDDKNGGAIFALYSSKLLIGHCLISNNRTANIYGASGQVGDPGTPGESVNSGHGGAIYLSESSPLIVSNIFHDNRTGNAQGGSGGPGYSFSGTWNVVGDDGGPGGTAESGRGGAIYSEFGSPSIVANIFIGNRTGVSNGGGGGSGGSAMTTQNYGHAYGGNAGNGAQGKSGGGGALSIIGGAPSIQGNIFAWNFTGDCVGGQGGTGGSAHFEYPVEAYTQGGLGGNGNTGIAGQGGAIYFSGSNASVISNLFLNYNRTGYGQGGNGGEGGGGNMFGPFTGNVGGDGGDGSDGFGGDGAACYAANYSAILENVTISLSVCGAGIGGNGGYGGFANIMGSDGSAGAGTDGLGVLNSTGAPLRLANSILWNNGGQSLYGSYQVSYSCIQGGAPGIGNINVNPWFVSASQGDYFLSQVAAGQNRQSPCVNAGCPDSALITGTTRTDGIQDTGITDMGFHYPCFAAPATLVVTPDTLFFTAMAGGVNPPPQTFQISNLSPDTFSFIVLAETNWFTVSILAGAVPPEIVDSVQVDISGLEQGQHSGFIYVRADSAQGSPDSILIRLTITPPTGLPNGQAGSIPHSFCLLPNQPNPFNGTTMITFGLPLFAPVRLSVYDLQGRCLAVLVDGIKSPGMHRAVWDASGLPSGLYICRLHAGNYTGSHKMFLIK